MGDRDPAVDPARHLSRARDRIGPGRHLPGSDRGRLDWSRGHGGRAGGPGIDHSPHGYMVQAEGEALRIPAQDLRTAMRHSPSLHAGFLRYAHALMVQTAQTAYANAGFTLEARLARWVLMTDDRLERDDLPLTHDFLAMMLGVQRPGVTLAIQALEGGGLIRAKRGSPLGAGPDGAGGARQGRLRACGSRVCP